MLTISLSRRTIAIAGAILAIIVLVLGLALVLGGSSRSTPRTAAGILDEIGPFRVDGYLCDRVQGFVPALGTSVAAEGVLSEAQNWLPGDIFLKKGNGGHSCVTAFVTKGAPLPTAEVMDATVSVYGPHWFISLGAPVPQSVLRMIEQRTGGIAG